MMSEFKVQKRNGGVIHAGYEYDEYLMSDCGAGRRTTRSGGTEARTWVKVEGEITCKRCLKKLAAQTQLEATEARRQQAKAEIAKPKPDVDAHAAAIAQMRANIDAEEEERAAARRARNRTNYAPAPVRTVNAETSPKPEPFTFEYDATAGILIAAALREKAKAHRKAAKGYRTNADLGTGLKDFYAEQARLADNNAQLLEDAADKIHKPVKAALANDMAHAIERTEVKARRAKREQSGMDSLRDMLKLS